MWQEGLETDVSECGFHKSITISLDLVAYYYSFVHNIYLATVTSVAIYNTTYLKQSL
jgi:hypothetical protein